MSPLQNARFGDAADQPTPSLNDKGTFWYSEDTGEVWLSDGVSWTLLGGPGSSSAPITSPQTDVAVDPYVALLSNGLYTLSVQVTSFTLPSGVADTDLILIKDYTGNATAQPHTINPSGGDTIDHAGSYSLNGDNDSVLLGYNPTDTNWMIL